MAPSLEKALRFKDSLQNYLRYIRLQDPHIFNGIRNQVFLEFEMNLYQLH